MPDYQEENTIDEFLRKLVESGGQDGPLDRTGNPTYIPSDPNFVPQSVAGPKPSPWDASKPGLPEPVSVPQPAFVGHPGEYGPQPTNFVPNAQEALGGPQGKGGLVPPPPGWQNAPAGLPGSDTPMYGGHPNPSTPMEPTRETPPFRLRFTPEEEAQMEKWRNESAPNAGVAKVPPPVDTSIPISEPLPASPPPSPTATSPEASSPEAASTPNPSYYQPAVPPSQSEDVRDRFMRDYAGPIQTSLQARAADLDRMERAKWSALQQSGVMGTAGNHAAQAAAIAKHLELAGQPVNLDTLHKAGQSSLELAKAEKASQEMDPTSPTSEAQRIALMASPLTDDWAKRSTAQGEFKNPVEAKSWMYRKLKTLHGAAMGSYIDTIMKGGDFSKQGAEINLTNMLAKKSSWEGEQIRLSFQTEESLVKALSDPNHPSSQSALAIMKSMIPKDKWNPAWDKMSALEVGRVTNAMSPALSMLQFQAQKQLEIEKERTLIPGEARYRTVPIQLAGMTAYVNPAGSDPIRDKNRLVMEQDIMNSALKAKREASLLTKIEGKLRVGQGSELAASLRELDGKLKAIDKSYGMNENESKLVGLLDKGGDIEVRSVLNSVDNIVNNAVGFVSNSARSSGGMIEREDAMAAAEKNNPKLLRNPILGGSATHPGASDIQPVEIINPYTKQQEPAWKQKVNGVTYYWVSSPYAEKRRIIDTDNTGEIEVKTAKKAR